MIRYINYLFTTSLKRSFVYVNIALYAITICVLMYLTSRNNTNTTAYPNAFMSWFSILFFSAFMVPVIVHAFKKQSEEGTELLISAKPISRKSIVFGKLFFVIMWFIICSIATLVIFAIGAQFDQVATMKDKLIYALSMFVGQIIIGWILLAIFLLLGTFLSKIGFTIISNMFIIFIFIFNMSVVPSTNATVPGFATANSYSKIIFTSEDDSNDITVANIYSDEYEINAITKNHNSSYNNIRYGDIWGQWNGVFQVIKKIPESISSATGFYITKKANYRNTEFSDLIKIKTDSPDTYYIGSNVVLTKVSKSLLTAGNKINEYLEKQNTFVPSKDAFSDDLSELAKDVQAYLEQAMIGYKPMEDDIPFLENVVAQRIDKVPAIRQGFKYSLNNNKYSIKQWTPEDEKDVIVTGFTPFINPTLTMIIWILIALLLTPIPMWVYLRKDFK